MTSSARPGRVRFGAFEADLSSAELFRDGRAVKLHQQPFEVLAILLEHPGELVTRDELRRRLWPSDTFVNFDLGLNSAVKKLRDALHDSADNPRYVQTLPRRGYRFIAAIDDPPTEQWLSRQRLRWAIVGAIALLIPLAVQDVTGRRQSAAAAPVIHALAVLPLDNLSGDSSQDYFADGMTDALITNLAQIGALKVISRTSAMRYKGTRKRLPDIARELGVDAIVEGAVIRAGDHVRIDAQLLDASTDRHLWSATYERNVGEITSVQSDIARAVANEIRVIVTPEVRARLLRTPSVDPETYELYMKGRYFWAKRAEDSDRKSIDYFQAAIQRRPDYAPAYAALADAYITNKDLPPRETFTKAKAAARAALRIDDTLAEAHHALAASLFYYDWDWAAAKQEFERALALDPNDSMAHQWYGQYQKALGWKGWAAEVQRAGELDPLSPIVAGGGWYLQAGQYDKAIDLLRKKVEIDPSLPYPHLLLGRAYTRKGLFEEAIQQLRIAIALSGGASEYVSRLGFAYGKAGRRADAMETLRHMKRLSERRYVSPYDLAVVYAGLGERDEAFRQLDKALEDHAVELVMLNVSAEMEPLRSDPRYAGLKRRVGLPE